MTKRRKILVWAAAGLALLIVGASLYGSFRWQQFKRDQGIVSFRIAEVGIAASHLSVRDIDLVRQPSADERQAISIRALRVDFADAWRLLPLRSIAIDRLEADWQPAPTDANEQAEQSAPLPDREQLERWAAWLPRDGQIRSFSVTLPCADSVCTENGQLNWHVSGIQPFAAVIDLQLVDGVHRLGLKAEAYEQGPETHVDFAVLLDERQRISIQNQFAPDAGSTLWRGTLAMSELPEAPWLLQWLGKWLPHEPQTLPELPEQMRIGAGWSTHLDMTDLSGTWDALDGEFRLSANLPLPWPVIGIGQLQGQLDVSARAEQGLWLPTELAADLRLRPEKSLTTELPAQLRPETVSLKITPRTASATAEAKTLPLQVLMTTSGPSTLSFEGPVLVNTSAPYSLSFEQTRLRLRIPSLTQADFALKGVDADLRLTGRASQDAATIRFGKGSKMTLDSLASGAELTASKVGVELAGIGIDASYTDGTLQTLAAKGKTAITLGELKQPALRPQGWRWNGNLAADRSKLSLDGPLSNEAGLSLPLTVAQDLSDRSTRLKVTLPDVFLRAGNPLAATLASWPQTLELNDGRLQGQAQVQLPASGSPSATATLNAKGLGGIFDRTELSGIDAELAATLRSGQLNLAIAELTVREANPGFTFGPLRFNGEFSGPLDALDKGRLAWSLAEVRLLGGRLWLEPGAANLAADIQQLQAQLRGLQLPLLLEAYPAEGLSGTGVIDGNMQLQRTEAGISIEQGSLKARDPGGALQFRSAKLQALGQSNPAMRLVTEALDDFHYDVLSSDLHYAADGKLDLALKLHGRNPALEGGRPINFSINLEEDIPALLTSLQLSDRVSETIQRRVQERLR